MSTRPEIDKPDIPEYGLYDLIFTKHGFFRGGRYDERRWHEPDCLGRGEDCTCSVKAIEQHYNDKADLEMNDE